MIDTNEYRPWQRLAHAVILCAIRDAHSGAKTRERFSDDARKFLVAPGVQRWMENVVGLSLPYRAFKFTGESNGKQR